MKKVKLLIAALGVALVASLALAPAAQAQDVRSVVADPMFVDAGGSATFTVSGSDWVGDSIAVLPCYLSS